MTRMKGRITTGWVGVRCCIGVEAMAMVSVGGRVGRQREWARGGGVHLGMDATISRRAVKVIGSH
jgi:hypothetical protein